MRHMLAFLQHKMPVHLMGIHHSEHQVLLAELNVSVTRKDGSMRKPAWGRMANLAGVCVCVTPFLCPFAPTRVMSRVLPLPIHTRKCPHPHSHIMYTCIIVQAHAHTDTLAAAYINTHTHTYTRIRTPKMCMVRVFVCVVS
jgi:hypothetical protein